MATGGERPSWRGQDRRQVSDGGGSAKWWLMLVSVGLIIAILVLLVLPMFRVSSHFVAITTGEVAGLGVPPIPFAQEDLEPLKRTKQLQFHQFLEANEGAKLNSLAAELEGYSISPKHVLMVYVSAQAAAFDGVPYLLDENFSPADGPLSSNASAFEVAGLLDQVDSVSAKQTVVFLDAGNVVSDARLGLPLNTFAFALQTLLESRDADTWVLLSHSVGESAQVSYLNQHSFFGRSITQAVSGEADRQVVGNDDAKVSLGELFAYVRSRVQAETGGTQTPLLFKCGQLPEEISPSELEFTVVELRREDDEPLSEKTENADTNEFAEPEPPAREPVAASSSDPSPVDEVAADENAAADESADAENPSPTVDSSNPE